MASGPPINVRTFGAVSDAEIERAMQAVWDAPMPPEFMVIDRRTGEQYRIVSEELRLLREVPSPAGLRRLFPALRSIVGKTST
jgi:hypothetical protein